MKIENDIKKDHILYQLMKFDNKLEVNKSGFESRVTMEVEKYFNSSPSDSKILEGVFDSETKSKLLNIQESKYQFFTNVLVHSGKRTSDIGKLNNKVDSKFFNVVKAIRKRSLSNKSVKNLNFNTRDNIPLTIVPEALIKDDNKKENIISASKF